MERRIVACREGRATAKDLQPRLLIVTELDSTQEEIDALCKVIEQEAKINQELPAYRAGEFMGSIRKVLKQGNGYKFKVILDGQSLAVGASGISEATSDQLSNALLGNSTVNSSEVSKFKTANADRLIAQCEAILKAGKRPAIIQLNEGAPVAIVVPDLSWIRDVRFAVPPQLSDDPIEQWWSQIYTAEKQQWLNDLAIRYIRKEVKTAAGKGALKEWVLPEFGIERFDDPRRAKLSQAWDEAKRKAKEKNA
jgi:hypothetical protein